jgi:hypothetical protein
MQMVAGCIQELQQEMAGAYKVEGPQVGETLVVLLRQGSEYCLQGFACGEFGAVCIAGGWQVASSYPRTSSDLGNCGLER